MSCYPRLFVTRLANTVDESALYRLFGDWCNVRSATIVREPAGRSRNFGFIEVETEQDVTLGLSLDGYLLHERRIVVARAKAK